MNQIKETKDYSIFKKIKGNRKVSSRHARNIAASIAESNLTALDPIIVNHKMEIIDGQHRLEALKKSGLPVYYIQADFATLNDVTLLNANLRAWKLQDYLDSYVDRGFEEYIKLRDYAERTTMPISVILPLMAGTPFSAGAEGKAASVLKDFKSGDFKIVTMEFAEEMARKLNDIRPYTDGNVWKNRNFIKAVVTAYKFVKHEELMKKIKDSGAHIVYQAGPLGYIRALEDICNFNAKVLKRFYG